MMGIGVSLILAAAGAIVAPDQAPPSDLFSHRGRHYTVENARIHTLPDEPIEVKVAAGGRQAAKLAGRIGDGLIGTSPEREILEAFDEAGGAGKRVRAGTPGVWATEETATSRSRAARHLPSV